MRVDADGLGRDNGIAIFYQCVGMSGERGSGGSTSFLVGGGSPVANGTSGFTPRLYPLLRMGLEEGDEVAREVVSGVAPARLADGSAEGVVALGADATVLDANAIARYWLGARTVLPLDHDIARAAFRRRSGAFSVRLEIPVVVVVRPASSVWAGRGAVVLGRLADPHYRPNGLRTVLRSLWGLTIVESRVTELAAEGLSPKEIAEQLGIARSTVHVHMRSVFKKLGVNRQPELVALVWRALPRWI